jgi:hypothetical protein
MALSFRADGQATFPGPDRLTITIDNPSQEAIVNASTKDEVAFFGNVTVDAVRGERIVVSLSPSVSTGWASSISPATMDVRDSNPNPFVVKVTVLESSLASEIGTLTIEGDARGGGLTTSANATAIITVRPYYRVMIEADGGAKKEVSPGGTAEFNLFIWNYGNAFDNLTLNIVNLKELRDMGWEARFNVTIIENVNVSDKGLVKLTVVPPHDLAPYKDESTTITIRVESQQASTQGSAVSQSLNVIVHQKGSNGTGLTTAIIISAAIVSAIAMVLRKRRMRRARLIQKHAGGPIR